MATETRPTGDGSSTRRTFLRATAAAAGAAALAPLPAGGVHVAGSDAIRIGLIGCGGRGTEAALNALNAGGDVRLVAVADVFPDRIDESLEKISARKPGQVDVERDRRFVGFDAYRKVLESGIDAVLIAAASHFHPEMLRAAVEAGKHIFCEKPHGIDIPGLKASMAACEEARRKKLSFVSGLCWRYDPGVRETMKWVRDGAIGEILAIQETYAGRPYIVRPRQAGWSEMEYQVRNWYHFNWLSGDQTAQQLIHSLDKASWALGDRPPVATWGMGGRQTCVGPMYGDQFDHHAVVFEYADGARVFGLTRDQDDCWNDTSDLIIGTKGQCEVLKGRIQGALNWQYDGPKANMYDVEHAELFESIRSGRPIDDSGYACLSTALAIVAQMACYSGQRIEWDRAMASPRTFALGRYGWDAEPPVRPGPDGRYPAPEQGKAEAARWGL